MGDRPKKTGVIHPPMFSSTETDEYSYSQLEDKQEWSRVKSGRKPPSATPPWEFPVIKKVFNFVKDVGENIMDDIKYQKGGDSWVGQEAQDVADLEYKKNKDGVTEELSFKEIMANFDPADEDSVKSLQAIIGAKEDSVFGPKSRERLSEYVMEHGESIPEGKYSSLDVGPESVYAQKYPHLQPGWKPHLEGNTLKSESDVEPIPDYVPPPSKEMPPMRERSDDDMEKIMKLMERD